MEHLIYNLFPDVAAAVNRGDDYMMQLAQDAVQPILQSLLGLLVVFSPDGPNVLETIASTTMDLALPAVNHIKALVASVVLYVWTFSSPRTVLTSSPQRASSGRISADWDTPGSALDISSHT